MRCPAPQLHLAPLTLGCGSIAALYVLDRSAVTNAAKSVANSLASALGGALCSPGRWLC